MCQYKMARAIFNAIIRGTEYQIPELSLAQRSNLIKQMKEIIVQGGSKSDAWNNLQKILKYWVQIKKKAENEINTLRSTTILEKHFIELSAQKYLTFMECIDSNQNRLKDSFKQMGTLVDNGTFTIALEENMNASPYDVNMGLKEFFLKYKDTVGIVEYINFSWGLSSGEMALLNVFSRLFSLTKEKSGERYLPENVDSERNAENAIILIDEADMLLHPAWQQKYMKSLLAFLSDVFKDTHIQLIVATHSPIMLSDIPKQNVMYMHKDQDGKVIVDNNNSHAETFGANIFRLFNDAFFLDEGAIGSFAEDKLTELLEMIDKQANSKTEEIKKRIEMIGDLYLQKKIEQIFLDKLDIPNRIVELEGQMQKIQDDISELKKSAEDSCRD